MPRQMTVPARRALRGSTIEESAAPITTTQSCGGGITDAVAQLAGPAFLGPYLTGTSSNGQAPRSPHQAQNTKGHSHQPRRFGIRPIRPCPGARRDCPLERRAIAAARSGRMPNAPGSSTRARSVGMRRTTRSAGQSGCHFAATLTRRSAMKVRHGRVGMWRGGRRSSMSVAAPFVWRCLSGSTMAPFPHPSHRTGHADFPASGSRTRPHAFAHGTSRPSRVRRTSPKVS